MGRYDDYEDKMRDIFTVFLSFDADQSGELSQTELQRLLEKSKLMDGVNQDVQEMFFTDLFKDTDSDGKGEIGFQ
eukprot:7964622-Pyramimonas_sp.AAC.1